MTLLGKIFIVLIFIMSLVFMSFAVAVYSTHRNWRELVENTEVTNDKPLGLKPQLQQARQKNEEFRAQLEKVQSRLAMEKAARRQALAALEAQSRQLGEQLAAMENRNQQLVQTQRTAIATMETTQNNLVRLKDEVSGLRGEVRLAQQDRDTQFGKVVALTDRIHQAHGKQRILNERNQQLSTQAARMKKVLSANDLSENTPLDNKPPKLNGVVLATNTKGDLVEVSIGSDDGLRVGNELDVFSKTGYLGRITIRKTTPDRSVGEVIPEYRKGHIQKGNCVSTKP